MKKSALLVYDNLDDRTEVNTMLASLSPADRMAFLDWCCRTCGKVRPAVRKMRDRIDGAYRSDRDDDALTREIFYDFWMLTAQWRLDAAYATVALERFARGHELPPVPPPAGRTSPPPSSSCGRPPVPLHSPCTHTTG